MEVPTSLRISSPSDFDELLRVLRELLDGGKLTQIGRPDSLGQFVDVRQLPPNGPWPDIVEADFSDEKGHEYHLFVDSFHGTGGEWRLTDTGPGC
jgi:hypothetical protein